MDPIYTNFILTNALNLSDRAFAGSSQPLVVFTSKKRSDHQVATPRYRTASVRVRNRFLPDTVEEVFATGLCSMLTFMPAPEFFPRPADPMTRVPPATSGKRSPSSMA